MTLNAMTVQRTADPTGNPCDDAPAVQALPPAGCSFFAQALGRTALRVVTADVVESLSALYACTVEFEASDAAFDLETLLGDRAALTITRGHCTRRVCGIVRRVAWLDAGGASRRGQLWLVPALWVLTQRTHTRIFQDLSAPEVVSRVIDAAGRDDVMATAILHRTYPPRAYATQYRETDLAFVSRVLEEAGITWFFRHDGPRETLVLTDAHPWATVPTLDTGPVPLAPRNSPGDARIDCVETVEGLAESREYQPASRSGIRTSDRHIEGRGNVTGFVPGGIFDLVGHGRPERDGRHLLTDVSHHVQMDDHGGPAGGYTNTFRCVPADTRWVPPRRTPRPMATTAELAVVTGVPGTVAERDAHGRIKLRLQAPPEEDVENPPFWIPVPRSSAVPGAGPDIPPVAGTGVSLQFHGGDPDRPVVSGWGDAPQGAPTMVDAAESSDARHGGIAHGGAGTVTSGPNGTSVEVTPIKLVHTMVGLTQMCGGSVIDLSPSTISLVTTTLSSSSLDTTLQANATMFIDGHDTKIDGTNSVNVKGPMIQLEADAMIVLRCGGSVITITSDQISIVSATVAIQGAPIKLNA